MLQKVFHVINPNTASLPHCTNDLVAGYVLLATYLTPPQPTTTTTNPSI